MHYDAIHLRCEPLGPRGPVCMRQDAGRQRQQRLSFDRSRHTSRSRVCTVGRRHIRVPVHRCGTVCGNSAPAGSGLCRQLPVGALRQRHDHRDPAAFAIRDPADAGAVASRRRISVHGRRRDRACAHLPRTVRADRPARCRLADHGLALHDLARGLSPLCHRLCALEIRQGRRPRRGCRVRLRF
jgi:hypothetical protein